MFTLCSWFSTAPLVAVFLYIADLQYNIDSFLTPETSHFLIAPVQIYMKDIKKKAKESKFTAHLIDAGYSLFASEKEEKAIRRLKACAEREELRKSEILDPLKGGVLTRKSKKNKIARM